MARHDWAPRVPRSLLVPRLFVCINRKHRTAGAQAGKVDRPPKPIAVFLSATRVCAGNACGLVAPFAQPFERLDEFRTRTQATVLQRQPAPGLT